MSMHGISIVSAMEKVTARYPALPVYILPICDNNWKIKGSPVKNKGNIIFIWRIRKANFQNTIAITALSYFRVSDSVLYQMFGNYAIFMLM